ncbi:Carbamoyl-phosphate synthase small chain [Kiritimatiella glycovorans]|uniref:Carbamoyl phosphate synthase small chain n=1 Tax=Kiritimatiella glycovorans TaxID=1307763 RepID=A0A0G3EIZ4_9BACT|nr:Carbamoyl-phosphate synthase small chain [Kiritimatiella glycovorans]
MDALIALEDGTFFRGRSFAGEGETSGELVFNTAMSGYQEILTDPSYYGQIVTMTYPLIGNYGVNPEDVESRRIFAAGLVVGECSRIPSSWRSRWSLPEYLEQNGVMGIERVDTRAITLHIRDKGAMRCVISTGDLNPESLVEKARNAPSLVGRNLIREVTAEAPYTWPEGGMPGAEFKVAVVDCGIKTNQLRLMQQLGCECRVFPCTTPAEAILAEHPDGIFISNGPGDPEGAEDVAAEVRKLIDSGRPLFGICFGHQMIALALGAETYKLKFGHRGANQPILDHRTHKVEIASHNHGFCVRGEGLPEEIEVTHVNLNDRTCAGLRHREKPLFSVQYHPEACPGPNDSFYLFKEFTELMRSHDG